MATLGFLNYNNYQNRILKGESVDSLTNVVSTEEGITSAKFDGVSLGAIYNKLNFDIKDGIETVHIINDQNRNDFPFDYMLVINPANNKVTSKWFVMEAQWNRKRQWRVHLLRDVKADFYDMYKDKPFYGIKGMPDSDSPLIYNQEGRGFNQILNKRITLTQTANQQNRYIIGFMDKTWDGGKIITEKYDAEYGSIADLPIAKYLNTHTYTRDVYPVVKFTLVNHSNPGIDQPATGDLFDLTIETIPGGDSRNRVKSLGNGTSYLGIPNIDAASLNTIGDNIVDNPTLRAPFESMYSRLSNQLSTSDKTAEDWWEKYDGKKILIGGRIYTFTLGTTTTVAYTGSAQLFNGERAACCNSLDTAAGGALWDHTLISDWNPVATMEVSRMPITETSYEASYSFISPNSGDSPNPYDIFVIEDSDAAREFVGWFASQYGKTFLYDLQLFPFEPPKENVGQTITVSGSTIYFYWATNDSNTGVLFHSSIRAYSNISHRKVASCQHMCRIIAPNGASAWEFNPALINANGIQAHRDGDDPDYFKYEFTLIPFNSYLHIFPVFRNLYGTENKTTDLLNPDKKGETRGLVCTGPWSLPYSTSNWATYQLNNSAYMDSFNRQIENMQVNYKIREDRILTEFQLASLGAIGTSLQQGLTGLVSAELGIIGAGIGAMKESEYNTRETAEAVNYTKDQFHNSLRNIQAQARPLAHNSSVTIGNSWFPIVEFYTATTQEENILLDDLKVYGWTLGELTLFSTLKSRATNSAPSRYIRGRLINVGLGEDAHIANVIMSELDKGVYINNV